MLQVRPLSPILRLRCENPLWQNNFMWFMILLITSKDTNNNTIHFYVPTYFGYYRPAPHNSLTIGCYYLHIMDEDAMGYRIKMSCPNSHSRYVVTLELEPKCECILKLYACFYIMTLSHWWVLHVFLVNCWDSTHIAIIFPDFIDWTHILQSSFYILLYWVLCEHGWTQTWFLHGTHSLRGDI